jgi:hypothetical protein
MRQWYCIVTPNLAPGLQFGHTLQELFALLGLLLDRLFAATLLHDRGADIAGHLGCQLLRQVFLGEPANKHAASVFG